VQKALEVGEVGRAQSPLPSPERSRVRVAGCEASVIFYTRWAAGAGSFTAPGYFPILKESRKRSAPHRNGITRDSALDMLSST
jgi:hypothetical protein